MSVADNSIPIYECVWNVTPESGEYWTYNGDTYDDEQDVQEAMGIDEDEYGVYIAHDIRYIPNTLEFSSETSDMKDKEKTSQGNGDKCYVAYYSGDYSNYILAALPAVILRTQFFKAT